MKLTTQWHYMAKVLRAENKLWSSFPNRNKQLEMISSKADEKNMTIIKVTHDKSMNNCFGDVRLNLTAQSYSFLRIYRPVVDPEHRIELGLIVSLCVLPTFALGGGQL